VKRHIHIAFVTLILYAGAITTTFADTESCKSARNSLRNEIAERNRSAQEVQILDFNLLREVEVGGSGPRSNGYQCWATVRLSKGSAQQIIRVIYTVLNLDQMLGMDIHATTVGIEYVCGDSVEQDKLYPPCSH
jgi:hypothetical protein